MPQYNFIDLTGKPFDRLTVIKRCPHKRARVYWHCQCVCGTIRCIAGNNLTALRVKSCGCLNKELARAMMLKHGKSGTPEHQTWHSMRQRCLDPGCPSFKNYGGRGITICEQWSTFETFLADMGPRPSPRHSIERLNNDGNYSKENCVWALRLQQGRNKRNNRLLTYQGRTQPLSAWAEEIGVKRHTLAYRLDGLGWSLERAFMVLITKS